MAQIQFPIKFAFAITSNKCQGHSIENIGVSLKRVKLSNLCTLGFFDYGQKYTVHETQKIEGLYIFCPWFDGLNKRPITLRKKQMRLVNIMDELYGF